MEKKTMTTSYNFIWLIRDSKFKGTFVNINECEEISMHMMIKF